MSKRAAIPEYIWYISLIVISIVLVTTVVTLTNKAKKSNYQLPEIRDASFTIYRTPTGEVKIGSIDILGIKKEDLKEVYLYCDGKMVSLNDLFNITIDFAKTPNNYLSLNKKDFEFNLTKYNFSDKCGEEGAKWSMFYGNPESNGVKIADTTVEFKSTW